MINYTIKDNRIYAQKDNRRWISDELKDFSGLNFTQKEDNILDLGSAILTEVVDKNIAISGTSAGGLICRYRIGRNGFYNLYFRGVGSKITVRITVGDINYTINCPDEVIFIRMVRCAANELIEVYFLKTFSEENLVSGDLNHTFIINLIN